MSQNIHYRLTLNLIAGYLLEEWTVDFGNGPIWERSEMNFPVHPANAADLHERHMCISHYRARKCADSRDQYVVIK